jgi:O-antigen ligase
MQSLWTPAWQRPWLVVPVGCGLLVAIAIALQWWSVLAILGSIAMIVLAPVEFAFCLLALSIPFDSVSQIAGNVTLSFLIAALSGLILITTALVGLRLQMMRKTALLFLLFSVWTAMSTFWALDTDLCMARLPSVAAIGALYLVAVSMHISNGEFEWIRRLTVLGGSIASAVALYQFVHGVTVASRASIVIGAYSTNPNELAASLILPVSFAVGGVLWGSSIKRVVLAFLALLMLACLALTMSRGAFAAILVMFAVYAWRKRVDWRMIALFGCAAAVALISSDIVITRVEAAFSSRAQGRIDIWLVGAQIVRHHGLLGVGLENFPYAFQRYAGHQVVFRTFEQAPHNIYLQAIAETGVIGLLLLVGALSCQMKEIGKSLKEVNEKVREILIPCEAAAWALVTHAFVANLLWRKMFWFTWIVVAVAVQVVHDYTRIESSTVKYERISSQCATNASTTSRCYTKDARRSPEAGVQEQA